MTNDERTMTGFRGIARRFVLRHSSFLRVVPSKQWSFVLRHSSFLRHSCFVIRHSLEHSHARNTVYPVRARPTVGTRPG
jgi:hypothetical protein